MTLPSPVPHLVEVLQFFNKQASIETLYEACLRMVLDSDLYNVVLIPYSEKDRDAIAEAIFLYITQPFERSLREIKLEKRRLIMGKKIEYGEFASQFSSDMFFENWKISDRLQEPSERLRKLNACFAALCFRYRWCVASDLDVFYISYLRVPLFIPLNSTTNGMDVFSVACRIPFCP